MWIVFDWAETKAFGPFDTRADAIRWLDNQGIGDPDQFELSIDMLIAPEMGKINQDIK